MELYIILKKSPQTKVWAVAFLGRVYTDYHQAELMLDIYKHQHPTYDARIIAFDVDKEYK